MVSRVQDSEQQPPKPQRSVNKLGSTPWTWITFMWQSETGCGTRWDMPARAANVRNTTFLASQWHRPSLSQEVYEHVLVNNYPPWPAPAPANPGSASRSQHLLKIGEFFKKRRKKKKGMRWSAWIALWVYCISSKNCLSSPLILLSQKVVGEFKLFFLNRTGSHSR